VLKGGMLLAAFDARRATADADALARDMANDEATVIARVVEIARLPDDDGVEFLTETVTARTIRDDALYAGVRVAMNARIATATMKFRLDVNFGDPITPAPQQIDLPSLRPGAAPIRVLGYPIETVLAEKIATAITLGAANTRVRDYADIYTLTGRHDLSHTGLRDTLLATTAYRGTPLEPLSSAVGDLVVLRRATYTAYRVSLGRDGQQLPEQFADVVAAVAVFADPLCEPATTGTACCASSMELLATSGVIRALAPHRQFSHDPRRERSRRVHSSATALDCVPQHTPGSPGKTHRVVPAIEAAPERKRHTSQRSMHPRERKCGAHRSVADRHRFAGRVDLRRRAARQSAGRAPRRCRGGDRGAAGAPAVRARDADPLGALAARRRGHGGSAALTDWSPGRVPVRRVLRGLPRGDCAYVRADRAGPVVGVASVHAAFGVTVGRAAGH